MKYVISIIFGILVCTSSLAHNKSFEDTTQEPQISVYQGSQPGTSVIVVKWPDGVVERLLYKNKDVAKGDTGYVTWFNQRYEAYLKRSGKR